MSKHALVIGVSEYDTDSGITPVLFAEEDAWAVIRCLRVNCRFDSVKLLTGRGKASRPSKDSIKTYFEEMRHKIGPDDLFLLYFAGHGLHQDRVSFVLPCDARATHIKETGLKMAELHDLVAGLGAKKRIEIFDCCRNDPLSKLDRGALDVFAMDEKLSRNLKVTPWSNESDGWWIHACDVDQKAWGLPEKRRGVFTHHLLEGLYGAAAKHANGVTVKDLNEYVCSETSKWAAACDKQQTPCSDITGKMHDVVLTTANKKHSPPSSFERRRGRQEAEETRQIAALYCKMAYLTGNRLSGPANSRRKLERLNKFSANLIPLATTADDDADQSETALDILALHAVVFDFFEENYQSSNPIMRGDWADAEYMQLKMDKDPASPLFWLSEENEQ